MSVPNLDHLHALFSRAWEIYREETAATARLVLSEEPDMSAVAVQRQLEREAYENYRNALLVYLSAVRDQSAPINSNAA